MDRGYIEKHGIERIVFADGLTVSDPLFIKLEAARRGLFRKLDYRVEVVWFQDGNIMSRCCWKDGVRIYFIRPEPVEDGKAWCEQFREDDFLPTAHPSAEAPPQAEGNAT